MLRQYFHSVFAQIEQDAFDFRGGLDSNPDRNLHGNADGVTAFAFKYGDGGAERCSGLSGRYRLVQNESCARAESLANLCLVGEQSCGD